MDKRALLDRLLPKGNPEVNDTRTTHSTSHGRAVASAISEIRSRPIRARLLNIHKKLQVLSTLSLQPLGPVKSQDPPFIKVFSNNLPILSINPRRNHHPLQTKGFSLRPKTAKDPRTHSRPLKFRFPSLQSNRLIKRIRPQSRKLQRNNSQHRGNVPSIRQSANRHQRIFTKLSLTRYPNFKKE